MVKDDLIRLRNTMEETLGFALDRSREIRKTLRLRQCEARFYGISNDWQDGIDRLARRGHELLVELRTVAPIAHAYDSALREPLQEALAAFEKLVASIEDVETETPAILLWEGERDLVLESIAKMNGGESNSASCGICRSVVLEKPDQLVHHFEKAHPLPGSSEMQLVPVGDQIAAVEASGEAFLAIYEEVMERLTADIETDADVSEARQGGRRPHPWRDIIRAKARERFRSQECEGATRNEARFLIKWATDRELPLDEKGGPPRLKTVEKWIAPDRPINAEASDKPFEKGPGQ